MGSIIVAMPQIEDANKISEMLKSRGDQTVEICTTGDGVLTSIKLMEFMLTAKKKMSELIAPVTIYPQYLENVRVEDKDVVLNDEDVLAAAKKVEENLEGDGRIILRASGTEPVVRVMAEAKTDEIAQSVVKEVIEVIKSKGYEA